MADKKLNELGTTKIFDFAYVEGSDSNQYKIDKENLGKQLTAEVHTNFGMIDSHCKYIFGQAENDQYSKISLRNLSKSIINDASTFYGNYDGNRPLYDGCFIMYHDSSLGVPCAVPYRSWTNLQNKGEEADGVLIIEGGHSLLVAPHEQECKWSINTGLAAEEGKSYNSTNRIALLDIWDGKERTERICTDASNSPFYQENLNNSTFAPGYCYNYTPHKIDASTGQRKKGLSAGKYWLPCVAELLMIYTHLHKINAGLALIDDAKLLCSNKTAKYKEWYWSSTEADGNYAWRLSLSTGSYASNGKKNETYHMTRPVSAFIDNYH